jgi:hypothetical protein
VRQGIAVDRPFRDWGDAIGLLLSAVRDEPRVVVIDEFPFLVKASPSLLGMNCSASPSARLAQES